MGEHHTDCLICPWLCLFYFTNKIRKIIKEQTISSTTSINSLGLKHLLVQSFLDRK